MKALTISKSNKYNIIIKNSPNSEYSVNFFNNYKVLYYNIVYLIKRIYLNIMWTFYIISEYNRVRI